MTSYRLQKKRFIIPSSTGGGREPPRAWPPQPAAAAELQGRLGDVALCVRIPQSGHFEALSSPSGCFKRTLWGRSVMRPTVGHLALRPQSVRARHADRRTPPRAKPGQIRLRPRSVRPSPAAGHPPQIQEGRRPGIGRRPGEGRAAASRRRSKGRGPPWAPRPRRGRDPGGKGSRSPRWARGGRPAPRAARASRRPSWSPAARQAAPAGAARSRRSARRCRRRR